MVSTEVGKQNLSNVKSKVSISFIMYSCNLSADISNLKKLKAVSKATFNIKHQELRTPESSVKTSKKSKESNFV